MIMHTFVKSNIIRKDTLMKMNKVHRKMRVTLTMRVALDDEGHISECSQVINLNVNFLKPLSNLIYLYAEKNCITN